MSGYDPELHVAGTWDEDQAELGRLRALLKQIAETPESKDAIQVWAWNAIKDSDPELWGLVVEEPGTGSQSVPDFSKK